MDGRILKNKGNIKKTMGQKKNGVVKFVSQFSQGGGGGIVLNSSENYGYILYLIITHQQVLYCICQMSYVVYC